MITVYLVSRAGGTSTTAFGPVIEKVARSESVQMNKGVNEDENKSERLYAKKAKKDVHNVFASL